MKNIEIIEDISKDEATLPIKITETEVLTEEKNINGWKIPAGVEITSPEIETTKKEIEAKISNLECDIATAQTNLTRMQTELATQQSLIAEAQPELTKIMVYRVPFTVSVSIQTTEKDATITPSASRNATYEIIVGDKEQTNEDTIATTKAEVIGGLTTDKEYIVKVRATDDYGNTVESEIITFIPKVQVAPNEEPIEP